MRCSANIATRLSRAQFNELEVSIPTRSLVDCITIMSEFEFSVHTGVYASVTQARVIAHRRGAPVRCRSMFGCRFGKRGVRFAVSATLRRGFQPLFWRDSGRAATR